MEMPFNAEAEKKRNIRLALGVASLGFLGFFCIYLIFIGIMFLSPRWFFSLIPFPSMSEEVAGLDGKLLIFSKNVAFRGATADSHPEEQATLRVYDGRSLSAAAGIKQYSSLYPTESKIYFFDKGLYRTFDGLRWEEYKSESIGSAPRGAVSAGGMWVLSTIKDKPSLNLIADNEAKEVPLPDDGSEGRPGICSSRIVSAGNALHLFRKSGSTVFWDRYDGKKWSQSQAFEGVGRYGVTVFRDKIYFVGSPRYGKDTSLTLRIYDNGAWSEPKVMSIRETLFGSLPAVFNGGMVIFQRSFFSSKYYLLGDSGEKVRGPFTIQSKFPLSGGIGKLLCIVFLPYIVFFAFIFSLSALIRRYKLKIWRNDSGEYEFASLFRRSLAKVIDSIVVTSPATAALYVLLKDGEFFDNPFRFVGSIFVLTISLMLGGFFYHSLLEGLWGKTIGKKLCGIVVLGDDFTKCTIWKGFLRNLLRIIDGLFSYLVAAVSLAGTMKWQRLGDVAAGTVVVRSGRKRRARL